MPIVNCRVGSGGDDVSREHAPGVLVARGPIVPVTITVPDTVQSSYVNLGSPIPEPVTGVALIDTGATSSCFDNSTALKAGLLTVGKGKIASASHPENEVPLYAGKMLLPGLNFDVKSGFGVELSGIDGIVALIGRDLLKIAIFVYNGPDETFTLAF